jgi:hypothetical protein
LTTKRGAVLTALLLGVVAVVQAGDYSNVRIFGDSLTDSGAYQALVGPNARFTTNPGTVWSENLGASYGSRSAPPMPPGRPGQRRDSPRSPAATILRSVAHASICSPAVSTTSRFCGRSSRR